MEGNISKIIIDYINYYENLISNKEYDEIPIEYWRWRSGAEV